MQHCFSYIDSVGIHAMHSEIVYTNQCSMIIPSSFQAFTWYTSKSGRISKFWLFGLPQFYGDSVDILLIYI